MLPEMASLKGVKPGDSGELADMIVQVLREGRRVTQKERNLLERAYSWGKSAREIMAVYQKLI
jgi:glycosyltransferase involved in cell wall biosynthesis